MKPIKLPAVPTVLNRIEEDYKIVLKEAAAWATTHGDAIVEEWRAWSEELMKAVAWVDDGQRKEFADRLGRIVQEAQRIRLETLAGAVI